MVSSRVSDECRMSVVGQTSVVVGFSPVSRAGREEAPWTLGSAAAAPCSTPAVLGLAARQPVSELTVTGVAAAAGVQRSTLCAHADSPTDLLRAALLAELDALRAGLLDDPTRETAASVADVTLGVLLHVRDHAAIYRRGLADDAGAASLHGMLSEHFLGSSRVLLRQGRLALPVVPGSRPRWRTMRRRGSSLRARSA